MAMTIGDSHEIVPDGTPQFAISSNLIPFFEIGLPDGSDLWLKGDIVGDGEFIFNGRIHLSAQRGAGTVIDNFPKGPAPHGWTKRPNLNGNGFELVSDGTILFGFEVLPNNTCHVTVNLYGEDGTLVAESTPETLKFHRGVPMILGHLISLGRE